MSMLSRLFTAGLAHIRMRRDPVAYARRLGVRVGPHTRFYGPRIGMFGSEPWMIKLGANVHVAGECQFLTHDGGTLVLRVADPDLEWSAPIIVEDNVFLGFRTIVLPGVRIGERSVVAAGAVVSRDVPSGSVVAGVPARVIMSVEEYQKKMRVKSLGLGHLGAAEKDQALRELYRAFLAE